MPILIISDTKTGKSQKVEIDEKGMPPLLGLKIGDLIDGSIAGLAGRRLQLMGGCDKDGFPMRSDVHGGIKTQVLLSGGVCFNPREKGERRKKTVRGNIVTAETTFLNFKIVEKQKE